MNWNESSEEDNKPEIKSNPFAQKAAKKKYDESESSEEEKRTVKTPKEKMLDLIKTNYAKIKDDIEDNNYSGISLEFDEVMKNSDKIKTLFSNLDNHEQ